MSSIVLSIKSLFSLTRLRNVSSDNMFHSTISIANLRLSFSLVYFGPGNLVPRLVQTHYWESSRKLRYDFLSNEKHTWGYVCLYSFANNYPATPGIDAQVAVYYWTSSRGLFIISILYKIKDTLCPHIVMPFSFGTNDSDYSNLDSCEPAWT
jgi:hypothetical protein